MFIEVNALRLLIVHFDSFLNFDSSDVRPELPSLLKASTVEKIVFITDGRADQVINLIKPHGYIPTSSQILEASSASESAFVLPMIKKAIDIAGVRLCECAILFADPNLLGPLKNARIGTVFVKLDEDGDVVARLYECCPDFIVTGSDVPVFLGGSIVGFYGEIKATENYPARLREMLIPFNEKSTGAMFRMQDPDNPELTIWSAGRYYDPVSPLYDKHSLSIRVLNAKDRAPAMEADRLAAILLAVLGQAVNDAAFDLVVSVPMKPKDIGRPNRLKIFLEKMLAMPAAKKIFTEKNVLPDALICVKDIGDQKRLGRVDRQRNIDGAYECQIDVSGKRVIVVDDIVTTRVTCCEIFKVLKESGAESVTWVTLAFHPFKIDSIALEPRLNCKCGGRLKATSNKDGGIFFGRCNKWKQGDPKDMHSPKPFDRGVKLLNEATGHVLDYHIQQLPGDVSF